MLTCSAREGVLSLGDTAWNDILAMGHQEGVRETERVIRPFETPNRKRRSPPYSASAVMGTGGDDVGFGAGANGGRVRSFSWLYRNKRSKRATPLFRSACIAQLP